MTKRDQKPQDELADEQPVDEPVDEESAASEGYNNPDDAPDPDLYR